MNAEDRGKLEAIKDLPRDFLSLKWNERIAWLIARLEAETQNHEVAVRSRESYAEQNERLASRLESAERQAEALEAEVARLREEVEWLGEIFDEGPNLSLDSAEDGRYRWPKWWGDIQKKLKRIISK